MMGEVAAFCGVRVLTFAVMSNHFHILVEVPVARWVEDAELLRRYRAIYAARRSEYMPSPEQLETVLGRHDPLAQHWRQRLNARMHDVSAFMKMLKQRFSVWYNKTHERFGAFWAERFKSVLVEGTVRALSTVAAYIDLNAVRAGLVDDPGEYRWCGYSEALAGLSEARVGLCACFGRPLSAWPDAVKSYRLILFGAGSRSEGGTRGSVDPQRGEAIARGEGQVSASEALRARVRYFTDGAVLGSRAFVEGWWLAHRDRLRLRRTREPVPLEGADWEDLCVFVRPRGIARAGSSGMGEG